MSYILIFICFFVLDVLDLVDLDVLDLAGLDALDLAGLDVLGLQDSDKMDYVSQSIITMWQLSLKLEYIKAFILT